jgi:hypothetical protein
VSAVLSRSEFRSQRLELRHLDNEHPLLGLDCLSVGDHHFGAVLGACIDLWGLMMDFSFLSQGLTFILSKLDAVVTFFGKLFQAVFLALWSMVKDVMCLGIDVLASAVSSGVAGVAALLPAGTLSNWSSYWSGVPAQMLTVLSAIGIVPAFAIIAVAISVRLVLQLIPFVRLGS